jgi:HD superfamily phosphohydrolase YqeK
MDLDGFDVPPRFLTSLRRWLFDEYVPRYIAMDSEWVPALQLKADHTRRVCEEILHIGRQLGLDQGALRLAELTALLHDVARFEQYARYQTYSDSRSFDHGQAGAAIIGEHGLLDPLDPEVREVVLAAVQNHNRGAVPVGRSAAEAFFSRLLRDADKLDIWRVVIEEYRSPTSHAFARLELPDTPGCSEAALQTLSDGRMLKLAELRNLNDFKLLQLGWVYDLNFQPSFCRTQEQGYVESLLDLLPRLPAIEEVGRSLLAYVEQRAEAAP